MFSKKISDQILNLDNLSIIELLNNFVDDSAESIFIQFWTTEALKQRLNNHNYDDDFWIQILCWKDSQSFNESFHCTPIYHELLVKLMNGENQEPVQNKILKQEFFNPKSFLWKTFDEEQKICPKHCLCNSVKCLQALLELVCKTTDHDNDDDVDNHELTINFVGQSSLLKILQNYSRHISTSQRCFLYSYLKFCSYLLKNFPTTTNPQNYDWWLHLDTGVEYDGDEHGLINHFRTAKDFCGNHLQSIQMDSLEFRYDCPLIRAYVELLVKLATTQCDSMNFLQKHLNILKFKIEQNNNQQQNIQQDLPFPIEWLIEIFISEDTELFELLYDILLIEKHQPEIIHKLFGYFITKSIYQDSSVLLEMLCTEDSTATALLKFLIAYLKILAAQEQTSNNEFNESILSTLSELRKKIQKLHSKQLFPYNPKPLLRLLGNIFK